MLKPLTATACFSKALLKNRLILWCGTNPFESLPATKVSYVVRLLTTECTPPLPFIQGGTINKQELIDNLKIFTLVDQYLFHTSKALKTLTFTEEKEAFTVTQKNLYLLLPSKISWMTDMLTDEKGISIVDAIREIYTPDTYKGFEKEETKPWY